MKQCNRCAKRDCKVMYSRFPTFRSKHKADAAILEMNCDDLDFGYKPLRTFKTKLIQVAFFNSQKSAESVIRLMAQFDLKVEDY